MVFIIFLVIEKIQLIIIPSDKADVMKIILMTRLDVWLSNKDANTASEKPPNKALMNKI